MNKNEILRRFHHATASFIKANSDDSGPRPCDLIQEQQNANTRKIDNGPKKAKVDESCRLEYGLTVTFLISDKRRRDPTGMLETIADMLVTLGLPDDSIRELPEGHWKRRFVDKGQEGAIIEIELLPKENL